MALLATQLEHPANRALGLQANWLWNGDLRLEVIKTVAQLLKGIELDVSTIIASSEVGRARNKELS
jgi:hypothetical protein